MSGRSTHITTTRLMAVPTDTNTHGHKLEQGRETDTASGIQCPQTNLLRKKTAQPSGFTTVAANKSEASTMVGCSYKNTLLLCPALK